jgi:arylsulfatase A-like enzyme
MDATNRRVAAGATLQGLIGAACCGLLFESIVLLLLYASSDLSIARPWRLLRAGETAAATVLVALGTGLILLRTPLLRSWARGEAVLVYAVSGLAFCLYPIFLAVSVSAIRTCAPHGRGRPARVTSFGTVILVLAALMVPSQEQPTGTGKPDILFFSVDTLRADHLGCYGYPLPTSPALDRLCEESIVFEQAMAPAPSTIPSYTSIMTGMWQRDHGVYSNYHKADDLLIMLAERLGTQGYVTASITEGSFPGTFANLAQGFDYVIQRGVTARTPMYSPSEAIRTLVHVIQTALAERLRWDLSATSNAAERWLYELRGRGPVFVHFYWPYPHQPYRPPPRYLERLPRLQVEADVSDAVHNYDGEILYTDRQIERILDVLRETGRYKDAWIFFTADHGEELGRVVADSTGNAERYFGHSRYLYDSSVRVPLFIRPPASVALPPRRVHEVVSTASIAATIYEVAEVERTKKMLAPLPLGAGQLGEAYAFSVTRSPVKPVDLVSIRTPEWRLVETRRPEPRIELYRTEDEGELENLVESEPEVARSLLERLQAWEPPGPTLVGDPEVLNLTDRERERLEALGYLM